MERALYTTLDSRQKEIRVLELLPGAYNDDLIMHLQVTRLNTGFLKFNALSYVWGQEKCAHKAFVNGQGISLGQNLDCALRSLRHNVSGHFFWIDAICINQEDLAERSQQVQLMGDLFSSAEEVIIWLGAEHPEDTFLINSISKAYIPTTAAETAHLIRAFKRISLQSWFNRVWVVQEMALAIKSPTLYLGQQSVRWDQFHDYLNMLDHLLQSRNSWGELLSSSGILDVKIRVNRLASIRRDASHRSTTLMDQLARTSLLQATDPRDKVYGVLGICNASPFQTLIVPDYSKSVQQVFIEATQTMLLHMCPYFCFPLRPPHDQPLEPLVEPLNLPSWALDLTIESRTTLSSSEIAHPFNYYSRSLDFRNLVASVPLSRPCSSFSADLQELHTFGVHIGTVAVSSGDAFYTSHTSPTNGELSATNIYDVYNNILKPRHVPALVFLEAITLNDDTTIDKDDFENLLLDRTDPKMNAHHNQNHRKARKDLDSSRSDFILFVTEEGHVGTVYHPEPTTAVQPGDVVAGLFGINLPFVLRPLPQKEHSKRRAYASKVRRFLGSNEKQRTNTEPGERKYSMVNIAHVVGHQYGHDFVQNAKPDARWEAFGFFGLHRYTIV